MTAPVPINPESLGAPRGYSNGMLVRGDHDLLFVAGQIGWNGQQQIVSDRFAHQFGQALENIVAVVREAGGAADSIVRLTIYVTDKREYFEQLKDVGAAYKKTMQRHFPVMALLEVKGLLESGAKVEIEATAAIPRQPLRRS